MSNPIRDEWISPCGNHRLILGDCLEVLPTLEAGSVRLLWSDPPYGHSNQDGDLQSARVRDKVRGARVADCQPIANDTPESFREVFSAALKSAADIMTPDCCCCCCCCCCGGGGPKPTFAWVSQQMDVQPWEFFHAVVWDKSARGNGLGWRYRRNYEFVMVSHLKGRRLAWANENVAVPNVLRIRPPIDRAHPNQKPVGLCELFIDLHTTKNETILDPFMGSGTTGVACVRLDRKFIGIELEPKYFAIAVDRMERELNRTPLFEQKTKRQRQLLEAIQ